MAGQVVPWALGPYLLGPNTRNQGIYTGDARELAKAIPDESVDLIFTDPVYDRIDDYRWLAETAKRVLKRDGAVLAFYGIGLLPDTVNALRSGGLKYRWNIPHLTPGASGYCDTGPSRYMGMLWMDKSGNSTLRPRLYDVVFTNGIQDWHIWRKNVYGLSLWVNSTTVPDSVVVDFFAGGGTVPAVCKQLGRRYLASEIDPDVAQRARERVRLTQPPLFVPEPEQLELGL